MKPTIMCTKNRGFIRRQGPAQRGILAIPVLRRWKQEDEVFKARVSFVVGDQTIKKLNKKGGMV